MNDDHFSILFRLISKSFAFRNNCSQLLNHEIIFYIKMWQSRWENRHIFCLFCFCCSTLLFSFAWDALSATHIPLRFLFSFCWFQVPSFSLFCLPRPLKICFLFLSLCFRFIRASTQPINLFHRKPHAVASIHYALIWKTYFLPKV